MEQTTSRLAGAIGKLWTVLIGGFTALTVWLVVSNYQDLNAGTAFFFKEAMVDAICLLLVVLGAEFVRWLFTGKGKGYRPAKLHLVPVVVAVLAFASYMAMEDIGRAKAQEKAAADERETQEVFRAAGYKTND
jgi:hypothetical protein